MKHYEKAVFDTDMKQLDHLGKYWSLIAEAVESNDEPTTASDKMQYRRVDRGTHWVIVWENRDYTPEHDLDDVVQVEVGIRKELQYRATVVRKHLRQWITKVRATKAKAREDFVRNTLVSIERNGVAREVFIELWRNSNQLKENLTSDDNIEVFMGALSEADLSVELFDDLCREYGTSLNELAARDGHHFY